MFDIHTFMCSYIYHLSHGWNIAIGRKLLLFHIFCIVLLVLTHSPVQASSSNSTHIRVDTLLIFELNRTGKL